MTSILILCSDSVLEIEKVAADIAKDAGQRVYSINMHAYRERFDEEGAEEYEFEPVIGTAPLVIILRNFNLASAKIQNNFSDVVDNKVVQRIPAHTYVLTTNGDYKALSRLQKSIIGGSQESLRGVVKGYLLKQGFSQAIINSASEIRVLGE